MATTVDPVALGDMFDRACGEGKPGHRILIRQAGRVLSAWAWDADYPDDAPRVAGQATVTGELVFGGPPAPDVGVDITTWFVADAVEVIDGSELADMMRAREADEAARPVLSLGAQGELVESPVVAADGSTVVAASDDPSLAYRRARGVVKGDEPAENIIRRLRDGSPGFVEGEVNIPLEAAKRELAAEMLRSLSSPKDKPAPAVDQLPMRRRTLARFCRDYAQAWEDGEEPALLGMLENNLQVATRRVLELVDP